MPEGPIVAQRVEDCWGELRSLLHEAEPSVKAWEALVALLMGWPDADDLSERALPYCQDALNRWDEAIRRAAPKALDARAMPDERARYEAIMALSTCPSLVALECFVGPGGSRYAQLETFETLEEARRVVERLERHVPLFSYHLLWYGLDVHLSCYHHGTLATHHTLVPALVATVSSPTDGATYTVRFDAGGEPVWPDGALDALGGEDEVGELCFDDGLDVRVSLDWDTLDLPPMPACASDEARHDVRVMSMYMRREYELRPGNTLDMEG